MMKGKKFAIIGSGTPSMLEKIAMVDFGAALMLEEAVKLKECHKTPEQKKLEAIQKLRSDMSDEMIAEYILIKRKQSKLSRAKRNYIVYKVDGLIKKGVLTKEELSLISE